MREGQAPGLNGPGRVEQAGGAGLVQFLERLVHIGERGRCGQRGSVTEDGGRLDEPPRALATCREPAADRPS